MPRGRLRLVGTFELLADEPTLVALEFSAENSSATKVIMPRFLSQWLNCWCTAPTNRLRPPSQRLCQVDRRQVKEHQNHLAAIPCECLFPQPITFNS